MEVFFPLLVDAMGTYSSSEEENSVILDSQSDSISWKKSYRVCGPPGDGGTRIRGLWSGIRTLSGAHNAPEGASLGWALTSSSQQLYPQNRLSYHFDMLLANLGHVSIFCARRTYYSIVNFSNISVFVACSPSDNGITDVLF